MLFNLKILIYLSKNNVYIQYIIKYMQIDDFNCVVILYSYFVNLIKLNYYSKSIMHTFPASF